MSFHIQPVFFTCRLFEEGGKWGDEYKLVVTVQKIGDVGYCTGCHGEFAMNDFRDLQRRLKKYGIKKLKWDRGIS